MNKNRGFYGMFFFALFTVVLLVTPAYAYLDAGSGSLIIQLILGAIVAGGAMIKIYWKKITMFFSKKKDV